jgi:F420-non-reducing hydrogenase large subunit
MGRTITINPVTRIEGHAKVELQVDDNDRVSAACFSVMDFRGFEAFLEGMQVAMMPTITARICGTCPVTHHVAAARAVDKVFDAAIPRPARLLRNILNLAGFIHSHSVHLFALAGPDLFLGLDAAPAERNIIGMARKHPELSRKALRLRSIGQIIAEIVGGRGIHPVTMVAGGVAAPLGAESVERIRTLAGEATTLGTELFGVCKNLLLSRHELLLSLPSQTAYLGTVREGTIDLYEGDLRLMNADGSVGEFATESWRDYLAERAIDGSYGKPVVCRTATGDIAYRVGPLARLNCAERMGTPLADAELDAYRRLGGRPCHQTVMYHYARLIELLYAIEKLDELCRDDDIRSTNVRATLSTPRPACAHVEAPRGVLIHDYDVDSEGIVTRANLVVATQQNIDGINETVRASAQRYLDQPDEMLLNAIEFGIRCYDPCLSCATHRVGEMRMDVVVRRDGAIVRRIRR